MLSRGIHKKGIGGFFELELVHGTVSPHKDALALSTGRACISFMIGQIQPSKVYLPFYLCDSAIEPFRIHQVAVEFYGIDLMFNPLHLPELKTGEYFFYVNYFGLKTQEAKKLKDLYGAGLILDNTHAFFLELQFGDQSFTSARKYFGVPDGAYLYMQVQPGSTERFERFTGISVAHSLNRLLGKNEIAYQQYCAYERSLSSDIHRISLYSEAILSQLPYETIMRQRRVNFLWLHEALKMYNRLDVPLNDGDVPFCYPFLPFRPIDKKMLHDNDFFIPSFWSDVPARNEVDFDTEKMLSNDLLPLPVDHRYDTNDMEIICNFIKQLLNGK